jgi:hypothetical protein
MSLKPLRFLSAAEDQGPILGPIDDTGFDRIVFYITDYPKKLRSITNPMVI